MQKIINAILLVAILLAASCGTKQPGDNAAITEKKAALEKLKTEQTKITGQISSAEAELAKAGPLFCNCRKSKTRDCYQSHRFRFHSLY